MNRNKISNAFALLLSNVVSESDEFKRSLLEDSVEAQPTDSSAMVIDEEVKQEGHATTMIDTSAQPRPAEKPADA